jgi:hypothetical protein
MKMMKKKRKKSIITRIYYDSAASTPRLQTEHEEHNGYKKGREDPHHIETTIGVSTAFL